MRHRLVRGHALPQQLHYMLLNLVPAVAYVLLNLTLHEECFLGWSSSYM